MEGRKRGKGEEGEVMKEVGAKGLPFSSQAGKCTQPAMRMCS